MNATIRQQIDTLLADPEKLLKKKPFTREIEPETTSETDRSVGYTDAVTVRLPRIRKKIIPQEQYARELNVYSHRCLRDENLPAITVKDDKGGFIEIEQYRLAVSIQKLVMQKQVRHLCTNANKHTLLNTEPTEQQSKDFMFIKQEWDERNMEGAKTKFVTAQRSFADGALLYFMDSDGGVRTKNISFDDGYVIITHKNNEDRHIVECLYYATTDNEGNTTRHLDCYDDEFVTYFTDNEADGTVNESGWVLKDQKKHGFSECPLITKRGSVAWENGQPIIEAFETLFNIFTVVNKRHGWGTLYVKGKFNQNAKKIAGSIVLNDTSLDPNADAKFLNPPDANNATEVLKYIMRMIMIACGTTFILPDDIRISGDTSGLAVEMTQELDMATAQEGVSEWQNVANKMMRLFKEGLAMELVNKKVKGYEDAITRFRNLRIHSSFMVWKPKSEEAHNQMLATLYGAGGISQQTFVERNTVSAPDEIARIQKEKEQQMAEEQKKAEQDMELEIKKNKAINKDKETPSQSASQSSTAKK